jgi:hypothetical protein
MQRIVYYSLFKLLICHPHKFSYSVPDEKFFFLCALLNFEAHDIYSYTQITNTMAEPTYLGGAQADIKWEEVCASCVIVQMEKLEIGVVSNNGRDRK